ncbi:hypothetical protein CRM22_009524 [Opisthorchis felineus]|uniref:Rootletin-like coiled-coil domain-containing protein n=1 Tax=Opisthorchis felineus TaxID=147828 RepID=A0A4S2L6P0_OPIFE|nr:hypothetical protein CRM22_009524 [Opisthorchis felineus]
MLREQLDQAIHANEGLSQDVARLTLAWRHAAQQLDKREAEWREEENAFNDYFAAEHSRLLALWRAVVGLRRQFGDLRQETERDLTQARTELSRHVQNLQSVCGNLEANLRTAEAESQANIRRETRHASVLEAEAADRVRSLTESLARSQARLAETENKLTELASAKERLTTQLADRDRILNTLSQLRSGISLGKKFTKKGKRGRPESETSGDEEHDTTTISEDGEDHLRATKLLIEHTHVMHQALSQIAQLVITDSVVADSDEVEEPSLVLQHPDWSLGRDSTRSSDHKTAKSEDEKTRPRSSSPTRTVDFREDVESDQQAYKLYGITQGDIAQLRRLAQSKYKAGSSLHLAESTVSAVQMALNRRAAHVHRLRFRTQALRDQLQALVRRSEDLENERQRVSEHAARLREDLEKQTLEVDKLARERDRIKHSFNLTDEERKLSETTRHTLNEQLRELQSELERNRSQLHDAAKQKDELDSEREKLQIEKDRTLRELSTVKSSLENAEKRAAGYREELATIRESLRRAELEKEVLNQEKCDALGTVSRVQARIDELEQKIYQSHIQETQLKDRVAQLETMLDMHERDNQHLAQQNAMAHSTELRLNEERASLRSEKQQLRDELDKVYMERGTMSAELEQVKENVVRLEAAKNRLEVETNELAHERQALIDSLNSAERQKAAMIDDLNTYRKESDRHAGLISRFTSEKEALAKQKAELLVQLSILERDARQQAEHIARLKGEKETLESSLFDAQELIEQLQTKQAALERETAELKLRRDTLQAELLRAHTNFQVELDKSQRSQRELGSQLHTELADLRSALTQAERRAKEAEEACLQAVLRADQAVSVMGRHQRLEAESTTDRETELRKSAEEVNRLTRALLAAQRERDEARLYSEQERQRALLRAAEEKAGLQERVSMLQQTITDLQVALERSHQESNVRGEQERSALRKATEEVRNFRNQLEETCAQHEREVHELRIRVHDLEAHRDQLIKETSDLQLQTRLAEESRDGNRSELLELARRVRTAEEANDAARRECIELRQRIAEAEREKNALDVSNDELRRQLKTAEMERVELVRMTNVTRSQLQGTEMDRTTAERRVADLQDNLKEVTTSAAEVRREAVELRNQLKKVTFERDSLDQEISELRHALKDSNAKEEISRRDKAGLKQRLLDLDSSKSALQSEVNSLTRQVTELEDALRSRERAANQATEEWHRDFRCLEETKKALEKKIEQSHLIIGELRTSLTETQTHLHGVEAELSDTLVARQEAETRLSAIHSILRRLLGFRQSQYLGLPDKTDTPQPEPDISPTEAMDDTEEDKSRKTGPRSMELFDLESQTQRSEEDGDSDLALKRVAERVLRSRLTTRSQTALRPRTRGFRRSQYDSSELYPPFIRRVRSSIRQRRSKSISPPRNKMDSITDRPTSVERNLDSLHKLGYAASEALETGPMGTTSELVLANISTQWQHTLRTHLGSIRYRGLPGSDLDPEAVRMVLREFLRHLVEIERDRDSKDIKARLSEEQLFDLRRQVADREQRIGQLQSTLNGIEHDKLGIMDQLRSMKAAISEQEAFMCKRDKEYDTAKDKLTVVEQQLALCEAEKMQLHARLDKLKSSETWLDEDRRQLLRSLDDAETRYTEAEVARRRLEGDLKRTRVAMGELEQDKQVTFVFLGEHTKITEQNTELQRSLNNLGLEKHEVECELNRLRKERNQWKKTVDRVERERNRDEEISGKIQSENKALIQSVRRLEDENLDLRRDLQKAQALLTQQEETRALRMTEINSKQRSELEAELERQRLALQQAEKTLQVKERSHRHRIRGLEEQVSLLKEQLTLEIHKRQMFTTKPYSLTSQPNLLYLSSTTTTELDPANEPRSRTEGSLLQETFPLGQYKPTIAPSRYDPYYFQVTGSIPSQLDRTYGVGGRLFQRDTGASLATSQPASAISKSDNLHPARSGEDRRKPAEEAPRSGEASSSQFSRPSGTTRLQTESPTGGGNRSTSESVLRQSSDKS